MGNATDRLAPGLLSGLALAGANQPPEANVSRQRGSEAGQEENGILTAEEIGAMNLRGADLVVLSACETGLGEVAGGEGVLGLQRAFQAAGARTVVASLWQVSDQATRALMERFYENRWKNHLGALASLRERNCGCCARGGGSPSPRRPVARSRHRIRTGFLPSSGQLLS